jgi:high affinity sulfate transporter 1
LIPAWIGAYRRDWFRADLGAGLSASTVVIPKAMACATIAGLPVAACLYTALAAMATYPFLGSSRVLSVTTTSTIALMTASEVVAIGRDGAGPVNPVVVGATLALLVGLFLLLARVLRLGFIANFVSKPVLVGFEAGIGIVIAVSQLKSLLGIHPAGRTVLGTLRELPALLPQTHVPTLCVALASLALLVGLPRLWPRLSAPLVVVSLGALAAAALGLAASGVDLVGAVPRGMPSFVRPDLSLVARLWPGALAIALMSFTESVASARTFLRPDDPPVDPNRELVATGIANVAAAFVGGFPSGGGASQTAVNARSGARSQAAQFVGAAFVVLCLLFLSGVIGLIPQAALGALVFVAAVSMVKVDKFRAIARVRKDELWWALVTAAGVVLIGTLEGILIAVAVSVLTLLYQSNHPPVYVVAHNLEKGIFRRLGEHAEDVTYPGLLVLRTEGRLTFANIDYVADKMRALVVESAPRVIVLECSAIPDIEYTALDTLVEANRKLRARGVELWLATVNPDLFRILERSALGAALGHGHMFFNLHKAVEAYRELGDN